VAILGNIWEARPTNAILHSETSSGCPRSERTKEKNFTMNRPEESESSGEKGEDRKFKVVPEGTYGGTKDKTIEVENDEPIAEDTGDQGGGQN
jgi:hypothetical protein